jgi:hypothetical protein
VQLSLDSLVILLLNLAVALAIRDEKCISDPRPDGPKIGVMFSRGTQLFNLAPLWCSGPLPNALTKRGA